MQLEQRPALRAFAPVLAFTPSGDASLGVCGCAIPMHLMVYFCPGTVMAGQSPTYGVTYQCQMGLRRHPKQHVLADAPDVDRTDELQWAEFRINAAIHRSYETHRSDRPSWKRETDLAHAAKNSLR
jgi:hypothetical protein